MTKDSVRNTASDDPPPIIPAELSPNMQSLLATLADIDFAHQREVEKVTNSGLDDVFKSRLTAKLDRLHRERRQPYTQELLRLQNRFRSLRSRESI